MTSAPKSDSIAPADGTITYCASSTARTPVKISTFPISRFPPPLTNQPLACLPSIAMIITSQGEASGSMAFDLADKAAIAGVGYTEFSRNSGVSTLTLALRAIMAALEDAGLPPERLDGIATHRVGDSIPAAIVAQAMGITDLTYFT